MGFVRTSNELARVLRVSPDRVRGWIRSGELQAINVAAVRCGRPKFVVLPSHLAAFEASHQAAEPEPAPRRRRPADVEDFYPD